MEIIIKKTIKNIIQNTKDKYIIQMDYMTF